MDGGNISGFFRQMGYPDDGTGSAQSNSGNYKQRLINRERSYARYNNIDPDTGEVLNFKPSANVRNPYKKMAYNRYSKSPLSGINLPKPATVINLAVIGAVGLVGYKLYNKFFGGADSIIDDAKAKGSIALVKTYVDDKQAKADTLISTQTSLANKGILTGTTSASIANTFHEWLDTASVDHDKIVNTILKQDVQTFRLVSVSYGTRPLNTYAKSPLHLLNGDVWSLSDSLFSTNKLVGTLKDHLRIVLFSSELTKIHAYYSVI